MSKRLYFMCQKCRLSFEVETVEGFKPWSAAHAKRCAIVPRKQPSVRSVLAKMKAPPKQKPLHRPEWLKRVLGEK